MGVDLDHALTGGHGIFGLNKASGSKETTPSTKLDISPMMGM